MAITQNGSKSLIKSLFGYNYSATAGTTNALVATTTGISGLVVTLAASTNVAFGNQIIVTTGGSTYVGLAKADTTGTSVTVDGWYTQSSGAVTTSLTVGAGTVTIVGQPLPGYYLSLSTAPTSALNSGSWTGASFGTATEATFNELAANGLVRKLATVAVTSVSTPTGANNTTSTITLSSTWTLTAAGAVTVNAIGIFNAPYIAQATRGATLDTLLFCTQVASAPTVSAINDQLVVTETISQS
jgi:hypothetical protein